MNHTTAGEIVRQRIVTVIDHHTSCYVCQRGIAKWEQGAILIVETAETNPLTGNFKAVSAHDNCR